MKTDLYLSYSGRKTYLTCPKQYMFRYIENKQGTKDPKGSIFGSAIGKVFEWFYNKKYWAEKDPVATCLAAADVALEETCDREGVSISLNRDFVSEVIRDMRKFIPPTVKIIRDHKLLSVNSRAEANLTVDYTSAAKGITVRIGGRADFIHGPTPLTIVDGKGSSHRGKYVDSEQLVWYATQHYLKYHVAPERLGFLYYKFPEDPVQWIMYDEDSIRANLSKTLEVSQKILAAEFEATPSGECHRCGYRFSCPEGMKHLASRRVQTGGRITESIFDIEDVT